MKAQVKTLGSGSNLNVLITATDDNGNEFYLHKAARMGAKMSPEKAELYVANWNEAYGGGGYVPDETSPEASQAAQTAVDNYVAEQEGKIATAQGKIDAANAVIAEQQAIIDNPESTEEQRAAAEAEIVKQQKIVTTQTNNIATYQNNIENAADKAPAASITEVPEVLVLDNTPKKGWKIEADFTANETTTIEANEQVEGGINIKNTGAEPANLVINVGESDVTLATNSNWNEVVVESVANDTLTVATHTHIKKLILKKGHVWVNNGAVEDCIEEVVQEGGTINANPAVEVTSLSKLGSSTPATYVINEPVSGSSITTGILTSGHFTYVNNATVQCTKTGSNLNGGFLIRGSKLLAEFKGEGEWHTANNPTIWLSDFDGVVKIHSGKFFNDANHAECIYAEKGFIEIYGGEFHNTETEAKNFLLNCLDANYASGKANITVYGGKFYGFDPAHNAAESSEMTTNFVAEGYESVNMGEYFEVRKAE